ncbi:MAG: PEP-CTERM sorting domain-containing protein [Bryobacteraceae bacterium]
MPSPYGFMWKLTTRVLSAALLLGTTTQAAQFQFGALIQAGFTSNSAPNWEVAVGATPGATAATSSLSSYWNNSENRHVVIEYLKPTNTVNVRVYEDATTASAFTQISYNPAGGAAVAATATWTLPASAFFVTATTGPTQATSIQISNLALSPVSGALNVIQPIQQTTLAASRAVGGPLASVAQTQDIVFTADTNGSWRLTGDIRLSGIQGGGRATGAELALNFSASANDAVPEPGTLGLTLIGGLAMFGLHRKRTSAKEAA